MAGKEEERAARGVDSVTDYVEEQEIGDVEKAKQALDSLINTNDNTNATSKSVVLTAQDIEFVAEECDLSKEKAEALLKKSDGSIKEALINYTKGM